MLVLLTVRPASRIAMRPSKHVWMLKRKATSTKKWNLTESACCCTSRQKLFESSSKRRSDLYSTRSCVFLPSPYRTVYQDGAAMNVQTNYCTFCTRRQRGSTGRFSCQVTFVPLWRLALPFLNKMWKTDLAAFLTFFFISSPFVPQRCVA